LILHAASAHGSPFLRDATLEDLAQWGNEMEPKSFLRAKHVISEDLRTVAASEALLRGDMKEVGRLMAEAHISYSKDFEGSCAEADLMVDLANELPGLIGARLTGGGFGGCTVSLVTHGAEEALRDKVMRDYADRTGLTPKVYAVETVDGAGKIELP